MIIAKGNLSKGCLGGKVVVVTGAGGGIGFEAARSLLWLGARVVIAEVDVEKGNGALRRLTEEFGPANIAFCRTDVADDASVAELREFVSQKFGPAYCVLNNATVAVTGAVHEVPLDVWDRSYAVNLRGPVLMTRHFLPDMLQRNEGAMIFVSSSGAAPYLGGYEVFKTAQVELGNTLAAEIETSDVSVFTIGPGIVKTETADDAIHKVAPLYGMTVEQFYAMNSHHMLSAEEAGAGFAVAVALADRYSGAEIGSIQALKDAGIGVGESSDALPQDPGDNSAATLIVLSEVRKTLAEQVDGWQKRNVFERQWMMRDFKKRLGAPPEVFLQSLTAAEEAMKQSSGHIRQCEPELRRLKAYYTNMREMAKGYARDKVKAEEYDAVILGWIKDVDSLLQGV